MITTDLASLPTSMLDEPPDELLAWGRAALADAGHRILDGEPVVRRRPWSTVVRLETDRGAVWLKGNAREFGGEAALLLLLARHTPAQVVPLIAADAARCRLLTADAGTRPAAGADWVGLMTGYAGLQTTMAAHAAELRRIGLADLTPPRLTGWYRTVLDRVHAEPAVRGLLTARNSTLSRSWSPSRGRWPPNSRRTAFPRRSSTTICTGQRRFRARPRPAPVRLGRRGPDAPVHRPRTGAAGVRPERRRRPEPDRGPAPAGGAADVVRR